MAINNGNTDALISTLTAWQEKGGAITCGVEIGVSRGETSRKLFAAFPHLNLYMVDPWRAADPTSGYAASGDGHARIGQHEHDKHRRLAESTTEDFALRRTMLQLTSQKAAERLGGRKFSFVFIDGDHTYEAVSQDIRLWWPKIAEPFKVKVYARGEQIGRDIPQHQIDKVPPDDIDERWYPGGILCGHDIDHPRDRRGVWGVRRAAEEFAEREGVQLNVEGDFWWVEKQGYSVSTTDD